MAAEGLGVAGAMGLRGEGIERREDAVAEDQETDGDHVPQATGGERLGREVAEHHRVHHAHQHDAELGRRHRRRQAGRGGKLGAEGGAVHEAPRLL